MYLPLFNRDHGFSRRRTPVREHVSRRRLFPRKRRDIGSTLLLILAFLVLLGSLISPAKAADVSSNRQQLASTLLNAHWEGKFDSITSGTIEQLIVPLAYGRQPANNCGVDTRVLQTLVLALNTYGSVRVSDINRICPNISTYPPCPTSYLSYHCTSDARAIDFLSVGGTRLTGDGNSVPFIQYLDGFVPGGTQVGQSNCGSGGFSSARIFRIQDSCDHLHVAFTGDGPIAGGGGDGGSSGVGGVLLEHSTGAKGWQTGNTGNVLGGDQISAVAVNQNVPKIIANSGGRIVHVVAMNGWKQLDSGIRVAANAPISAVYMGSGDPQVMANNDGRILQIAVVGGKWVAMDTGVRVAAGSPISAVRVQQGGWPQVMVNDGGRILQVAVVGGQWKAMDTGVRIQPRSPIVALPNGGWPQVIANDGGSIVQIAAMNGWKRLDTSIRVPSGAPIAATWSPGWPQIFASENGVLMHIGVAGGKWVKMMSSVRLRANAPITAARILPENAPESQRVPRVYSLH